DISIPPRLTLLPYTTLFRSPKWKVELQESYAKDGAAFLSIHATDPDLLMDVDPNRVATASKASGRALKKFQQYIMNDWVTWTVRSEEHTSELQSRFDLVCRL